MKAIWQIPVTNGQVGKSQSASQLRVNIAIWAFQQHDEFVRRGKEFMKPHITASWAMEE